MSENADILNSTDPKTAIFNANKDLIERKRELKAIADNYKTKIKQEEAYIEKLTSEGVEDDGVKQIIAKSYIRLYQLEDDFKMESQDIKDQIKEIKEVIRNSVEQLRNQ